nr:MAG TPA: hypothetical protein [Caudoviricetes sp.]
MDCHHQCRESVPDRPPCGGFGCLCFLMFILIL